MGPATQGRPRADRWEEAARELLSAAPAVDLHCDTIGAALREVDIMASEEPQAGPARLARGGFGAAVYAFWIPAHLGPDRGWARAEAMWSALRRVRSACAIRDDTASLELVPALEDGRVLWGHPERVSRLAAWGARYVTLTWNAGNRWASSWEDTRRGVGLTPAGRSLVDALDEAGIAVDLSHLSDRAAFDVLAVARRPPLASHSSARALCPHPRNVSDALAAAIADRGGVIGVNVWRQFLATAIARVDLESVVAHVEHLWNVAGDAAVAFGSDFDGIPDGPLGLEGSDRFPGLVGELLARGHRRERLVRFVRTNAERVLESGGASEER